MILRSTRRPTRSRLASTATCCAGRPLDATFSRRYRIMYLSETAAGSPTVVTGLVELPDDRAPFGGFKALLYGHGSTGLDDPCSPSVVIDDGSGAGHADEFDSMSTAINDGWAVSPPTTKASADPARTRCSSASVRAGACSTPDVLPASFRSPTSANTTAAFGFSQGGHAALWATQLAAEWTPEQPIVGTVAVASPSEVTSARVVERRPAGSPRRRRRRRRRQWPHRTSGPPSP